MQKELAVDQEISRRGFLRETALLGAAVAAMRATDVVADEAKPAVLPKIRLGSLEVSRLILGSNPFAGYAHSSGDLGQRMVAYFTPDRIMQTLDQAADLGVTAVASPPDPKWIDLFHRYLDQGGKLKIWIAQSHGSSKKMLDEITRAAKGGAKAIFVQGHRVEEQFGKGKMDVLRSWMEHIKSFDLPAGMAAHRPDIHPVSEKEDLPTDFYFQCFFRADQRPENYELPCRDRAVETIRSITKKPVVAYKILGAGRLQPKEAFAYAFQNIAAKDGVCVGIYPEHNPGMLAQDVSLVPKG
jgi:hypothetical protein